MNPCKGPAAGRSRPTAERHRRTYEPPCCRRHALLYAQPLTRVVQLRVDDVLHDGETTLLRLGEPTPVPAPVAALLLAYIADRANMNTATNHASCWLFPGCRAGRPARPDHPSARLGETGVPVAAAIRQQLLGLPAPVVADALGYHHKTSSHLLGESGGTWSRYAAGDHARSPAGWAPQGTGADCREWFRTSSSELVAGLVVALVLLPRWLVR